MTDTMRALVDEMRVKASMIELGEKIAWGSEVALMRQAADALTRSEALLAGREGWKPIVKPLEWVRTVDGSYGVPGETWNVLSICGMYVATIDGVSLNHCGVANATNGIEAAKAAAQADYEARILSALAPPPPTVTMKGEGE